jgi:hypothetical protein
VEPPTVLEAPTGSKRSLENDTGALKRILQRLETLKALQEPERRLSKRRERVVARPYAMQMRGRARPRSQTVRYQ